MTAKPRDPGETCTCSEPIVVIEAERKGAARRVCARCGRSIRISF